MKNLKIFLIAAAMILGAVAARAEFRWGPTAGVNLSTLNFSQELFSVDRSVGEVAGITGEMMFPGIGFGVDFSALYSQEGATLHLGERRIWAVDGYKSPRAYLHYLSIPINLRFKWTRMDGFEETLAPYVYGGPTISILCGHSGIKAIDYAAGSIGLQAGVGVELKRHWQIQGQYMWGMTYGLKMKKLTDFSARSGVWQLRVAYMF
ncbi:porin family protein [Muribaculaceae bacterium Isolate-013 (NCI)]|nr:porin family protein [Muribaculaceae bacterium Isolate-013 (NCI)]